MTMAGPKMGPRPADFDEQLIRQSPTFIKWLALPKGGKLRYACRDFVKGQGDEEERLMRRIMIARRNNVKDHQTLKRARHITSNDAKQPQDQQQLQTSAPLAKAIKSESGRKRRPATVFTDTEIVKEMDVAAVEATRSYRKWKSLKEGEVLTYNQSYIKGDPKHEWLLKKNIWRRMRYRRENKKIVEKLKLEHDGVEDNDHPAVSAETTNTRNRSTRGAVAAAAAAAASQASLDADVVDNPLDAVADPAALDAAARLADAATVDEAAVLAATAAVSQNAAEV